MEVGDAEEHVTRLLKEWLEQEQIAKTAAQRATGLGKILRAYVELFPELASLVGPSSGEIGITRPEPPRGAEAVRLVLQETPDRHWYVSELVDELKERGWLPDSDNPASAVRAALERLISSDTSDVRKWRDNDNKVIYTYSPDLAEDAEPARPQRPTYDYGDEPF